MTPNFKECCVALGIDEDSKLTGEQLGHNLQERFGLNDILVTMGAQGMIYVPSDRAKATIYRKAQAKEVFDVSGAGDTVAAILTLGLGAAASFENVLNLANLAAAIVVGKWGTQAVQAEELKRAVLLENETLTHELSSHSKMISSEDITQFLKKLKKDGKQLVFTNGCFDILHAGHVDYLEKAKQLGDVLIVGINTDASIKKIKGPSRPIVNLSNRMKLLSGLSCVDYIIPFSEDTPLKLIESISPNILVKGADYKEDEIVGAKHVKANGGRVQTIELVPDISTSMIIERIKKDLH
jgi:D-beta-D-heptose 7-phosphate kinase/D-beta-D-heptose 1-phosphate adenosyltransferase